MATNSGQLLQLLIQSGLAPSIASVVANALANAATPQFSNTRDVTDNTPVAPLRLIDADARKYQFTNLDYSSEPPYQRRLESHPGQYVSGKTDHPYKDSQPVAPVPPLSQSRVQAGAYTDVGNIVQDGSPVAIVSLKISQSPGSHLRINPATNSVEAVPLEIYSPQNLVTAKVVEEKDSTTIQLFVRQLQTSQVVTADGSIKNVSSWIDTQASSPSSVQFSVPTGCVLPFAYATLSDSRWLYCDGTAYSRTTYGALFAVIGTTYGAGNGSTTFNVPDLRGYFLRGYGTNSDGSASSALGTKQVDATKLPSSAFTGTTDTQGAHTHDLVLPRGDATYNQASGNTVWGNTPNRTWTTTSAGAHAHGVTITGGGDAETRPKNMAMAFYIRS